MTTAAPSPDTLPTNAVVEYNEIEAALDALRTEFAGKTFDLTTTAGDKLAREIRGKFVKLRTRLETMRTDLKAPVLARGRALDAEAARITAQLIALEKPIDAQIKADERRRAEEAAEKARIERERVSALRKRIATIQDAPRASIGAPAARIATVIENLEALKVGDDFDDMIDDAMAARNTSLEALRALHAQAVQAEAAARELEAARAETKRLADAQAARDAAEAEDRRLKAIQAAADASFDAPAGEVGLAKGGYDIPAGVNPVAILSEGGSVLPRAVANAIRDMPPSGETFQLHARPSGITRPITVSAPVSAPAPVARPASPSAWPDQVERPRAPSTAAPAMSRPVAGSSSAPTTQFVEVRVPKPLIEQLLEHGEHGDADQDEEWNEILNSFRRLIGVPLVEFVA